jgi:hypothetical protein
MTADRARAPLVSAAAGVAESSSETAHLRADPRLSRGGAIG